MKIVCIVQRFPKLSETFILNELLEMQKKGIDLEVYAFFRGREGIIHDGVKNIRKIRYLSVNPLKNFYAHLYFLFINPKRYLCALSIAMRSLNGAPIVFLLYLYNVIAISKTRPDHIHAYFGWITTDLAMLTAVLNGTPYTFTTYRYDIFTLPLNNYALKSRLAKKHITVSEFNKRYIIEKFGVDEDEMEVIHSGIDFDRRPPGGGHKEENTIIFVGRLVEHKGMFNLAEACLELKKSKTKFQCRIVGSGPQEKRLREFIENSGLAGEVMLLGNKRQEEVYRLISESTVLVLPSHSEGMPLVLLEAMALHTAVVSTRIAGIPELVEDRKSGLLISPGDITMLADRIRTLLTNGGLRSALEEAAYKKVFEEFNLRTETDKLVKIWKAAV